ncbi:MAG: RC-LH1 core complex protein PufX [Marinovum sp.]|nr:RC-LH1 core complex protein PufX [Marinovum sp.]
MYENKDDTMEPVEATKEVLWQMVKGMLATAALFVGIGLFLYGIYLVSLLLPPESKEADDPTPDSFSVLFAPEDTRLS